jgi:hypothetical protein
MEAAERVRRLQSTSAAEKPRLSKTQLCWTQTSQMREFFFASLAAVLCELCGYKLFLFTESAFKNQKPLTAKIAKGTRRPPSVGVGKSPP